MPSETPKDPPKSLGLTAVEALGEVSALTPVFQKGELRLGG